jgi:hypothetical protein
LQGAPEPRWNPHRRTSKWPPLNCGRLTLNKDELHPRHHRLLPRAAGRRPTRCRRVGPARIA